MIEKKSMDRLILSIMSYHSYDIREIDPYDMGIRSKFQNHSPEIRHDRKNSSKLG